MKLRNKKTGAIYDVLLREREVGGYPCIIVCDKKAYRQSKTKFGVTNYVLGDYRSLDELNEEWEDYKPTEPLIKDEKIRKVVRAWAKYNQTESVQVYNLVFDHGGVCIENELLRFYDPLLRTNIDVWFHTKAPKFNSGQEYTITELCGEEEE